jgi:hypothetical protein
VSGPSYLVATTLTASVLSSDIESFVLGNDKRKGWPGFHDLRQQWPAVSLPQVQIALQVTASSPQ